jgi:excinuclease UvrABC nuclease subunit
MKKITCSVNGAFPFRRSSIESRVPKSSGIYIFWSNKFCIYVGQAKNIQDRLLSHWAESHNSDLNKWLRCPTVSLCITFELCNSNLSNHEQICIDRHQPHLNKINARSK